MDKHKGYQIKTKDNYIIGKDIETDLYFIKSEGGFTTYFVTEEEAVRFLESISREDNIIIIGGRRLKGRHIIRRVRNEVHKLH